MARPSEWHRQRTTGCLPVVHSSLFRSLDFMIIIITTIIITKECAKVVLYNNKTKLVQKLVLSL